MPSSHSIDPSILRTLALPRSTPVTLTPLARGDSSAETHKLTTPTSSYFLKTAESPAAKVMFRGEDASLNAIHAVVPSLCPKSFGWGALESSSAGWFLVTEYLDLGASASGGGKATMSLAQKLAILHTTSAPIPPGYDTPQFGFPVETCCGDTPQSNTFSASWSHFFAEERLMFILRRSEAANGPDAELRGVVERVVQRVVPRLLGEGHLGGVKGVRPVIVHGDLWSGNKGRGIIGSEGKDGAVQDVVFDASACYAHSEYDIGIMNMFGGFGKGFWEEYYAIVPREEPVGEFEDRVKLYELYHHLNHHAMFGGGYKHGAMRIMKSLIGKYGD